MYPPQQPPPPGYPGYGPPGYGPPGYPPPQPAPPPPKTSSVSPRLVIYGIGFALVAIGVIAMAVVAAIDAGRNYVVFDTDGKDYHARIDGKDVGTAKSPMTKAIEAGKHKLELVDGKGQVVATATPSVPAKGWRAVVSSVPNTRYAIVTVRYDSSTKPEVVMFQKRGDGLHALDDKGSLLEMDMSTIGQTFPTTAKKGTTSTRLCRVDAQGEPECLK